MINLIEQAVANILTGMTVDGQIAELIETYTKAELHGIAKRIGKVAGAGGAIGAAGGYIKAKSEGKKGKAALKTAAKGALVGGVAGAGVSGSAEYGKHLVRGVQKHFDKKIGDIKTHYDAKAAKFDKDADYFRGVAKRGSKALNKFDKTSEKVQGAKETVSGAREKIKNVFKWGRGNN